LKKINFYGFEENENFEEFKKQQISNFFITYFINFEKIKLILYDIKLFYQ
jgi:hypothetical protein